MTTTNEIQQRITDLEAARRKADAAEQERIDRETAHQRELEHLEGELKTARQQARESRLQDAIAQDADMLAENERLADVFRAIVTDLAGKLLTVLDSVAPALEDSYYAQENAVLQGIQDYMQGYEPPPPGPFDSMYEKAMASIRHQQQAYNKFGVALSPAVVLVDCIAHAPDEHMKAAFQALYYLAYRSIVTANAEYDPRNQAAIERRNRIFPARGS